MVKANKTLREPVVTKAHVDTVLVEQSDRRLAEVEIAKRTGNAFVSVGTEGSEIVPQEVADHIAYDKSLENITTLDNGTPVAAHRQDWIQALAENDSLVELTNEEKADAASEYSGDLARRQHEQNKKDRARVANDPDVIAREIQERQARLADQYAEHMKDWMGARQDRLENAPSVVDIIDEIVKVIDVKDLNAPYEQRLAKYEQVVTVPDAMEHPAQEALITKDEIIATKKDFRDYAEGGNLTPEEQEAQVEEVAEEEPKSPAPAKIEVSENTAHVAKSNESKK